MKDAERASMRAGHRVELLQGGNDLFPAMVEAMDKAVSEIRLETYIFYWDSAGEQIAEALARAARRGVAVYLVMDGAGTGAVPRAWGQRFDEAGVQWRVFRPLGRLGLFIPSRWRRLHRKLCVVDRQVAFCGGINILDDWIDPNHGRLVAPRLDFAVRVRGPLVQSAFEATAQLWWRMQAASRVREADLSAVLRDLDRGAGEAAQPAGVSGPAHAGARAMLLLRDNLRNRNRIERAYRKAIAEARQEIIIANAYFAPGLKLRQALIHAVRRGVQVRLLLQGRYEYFMQFHAVRMMYGVLLGAGIEIHEYSPSFLHAKVAVIDGRWATVGSSNLDPLSLLLAREANVAVDNQAFAQNLRQRLILAMEHEGRRIDPSAYAGRPWHQRLLDRCAFALMRIAVFLTGNRY